MMFAHNLSGILEKISAGMSVVLTVYVGISVLYLFQDVSVFYATFLAFVVVISAVDHLKNAVEKGEVVPSLGSTFRTLLAWMALVVSICVTVYIAFNAGRLQMVQPFITELDVFIGWLLVGIMVFLITVHWGVLFGAIIGISIVYFLWGHLIPNELLAHPPYSIPFVISYLGMNATEGFFRFIGLLTDKIYFLVLFATFLLGVGLLSLLMELGKAFGKRVRGGAAFPAIMGSTAVGSVMGQAVANIALTGQLTIPMMIKYGFRKSTAGAIETVASTSGQLVPPILGLAAFMIAAVLNIPYIEVALNAVYPAVLYIATTTVAILMVSRIQHIGYLREEVDWHLIIRLLPTFLLPFALVLTLLMLYYSPSLAGLIGIPFVLVLSLFQGRKHRPKLKELVGHIRGGLRLVVLLSLLGIGVGGFAQVVGITQIASNLGTYFGMVLPSNMILLLVITMIICIIAGMGLPTPVAYLLVALTVGPFLQELGIPALIAHFFVFYFAIFSTVSPPVALGCLAACKISGGSFFKTSLEAMKIVGPTFITPFVFVYNPRLLEFPHISGHGLFVLGLTFLVQVVLGMGLVGHFRSPLNFVERLGAVISGSFGTVYLICHSNYFLLAFLTSCALGLVWIFFGKHAGLKAVPETH